jgi:hypothetical protein
MSMIWRSRRLSAVSLGICYINNTNATKIT